MKLVFLGNCTNRFGTTKLKFMNADTLKINRGTNTNVNHKRILRTKNK